MKEIFKDIPWWEWLYQISNMGNIFSWLRKWSWWHKWLILNPSINWNWYFQVMLRNKLITKTYRCHRLVALVFLDNPENKKTVNHKNWDKLDNRISNLEWNTYSENILHSYKILWRKWALLWKFGKEHNRSRKIKQYNLDWHLIKVWDSISDIERELWVHHSNIIGVCKWRRKTSKWYFWSYFNTNKLYKQWGSN